MDVTFATILPLLPLRHGQVVPRPILTMMRGGELTAGCCLKLDALVSTTRRKGKEMKLDREKKEINVGEFLIKKLIVGDASRIILWFVSLLKAPHTYLLSSTYCEQRLPTYLPTYLPT